MKQKILQPYFLLALLASAFALVYFIFSAFLIPFLLAVMSAVVLQPYNKVLVRKVKNETLAASITLLVAVSCILAPLTVVGILVSRDAQQLYFSLSGGEGSVYLYTFLQQAESFVHTLAPRITFSTDLYAYVNEYSKIALSWLVGNVGVIFSGLASVLVSLLIFLISLYYLLRDGATFKKMIIEYSPLDDADDEAIWTKLEAAVNSTIKGTLITAAIQGFVAAIGFLLFGVPNTILWGVVAAVASLVPGIGTMIVIIPGTAYLFLTGDTVAAMGLLVWGVVLVGNIDNFVRPKLLGKGLQLHPLVVLFSVLGGVSFFGPSGIFLGPLSVAFLVGVLAVQSREAKKVSTRNKKESVATPN